MAAGLLAAAWALSGAEFVARWLLAPGAFDAARLSVSGTRAGAATARSARRAFYSGHSLSDGVPEEVVRIASSKGQSFDLALESLPGSLLAERVARRRGRILRSEREVYDALVVTERHDLPYAARVHHTARHLRKMHEELVAREPGLDTFFYQVWLEIDFDHPERFVSYERRALPFWECVASAVNATLASEGRAGRLRVLPGAAALAELVERMSEGQVAGAPGATPRERVESLFRDRVHPSELTLYFMGAVHYAALFEASPEGAALPSGVTPELGASLQRLAWQYVAPYLEQAPGAAERDMAVCREYASQVMCPLFVAHPRDSEPEHPLRMWRRKRACQAAYADATDPDNPFQ